MHLCSAFVLAAVTLCLALTPWRIGRPRCLCSATADYHEDERTGRLLADLRIDLIEDGDTARLVIHVSAIGPRVEPIPGFRGVAGANHITAYELTTLLGEDAIRIVNVTADGVVDRAGDVRPGRTGCIPERRLRADGSFDLQAESRTRYILDADLVSAPLPLGRCRVEVVVRGRPRLRVDAEWCRGVGRIDAVSSLSGHDLGL